jgi:cytochrome oxidase Cu insertion factor (SCO1/SenC/PrrC family)
VLAVGAAAHDAPLPGPAPAASDAARFDFAPPESGTYALPPIKRAGDGAVLDSQGRARRLADVMDGRITVLSFVYTNCADPGGCPLATAALFDILDAATGDAMLAANVKLVSLSFDPARDSPAAMAQYGAAASMRPDPKPSWDFLTCESDETLAPILAAYGQWVDKLGADGNFAHVLRVYLIDRKGWIRNIYGVSYLDPRLLLADIRTLLLEERASR